MLFDRRPDAVVPGACAPLLSAPLTGVSEARGLTIEPERVLVLHSTRHLLPPVRATDFTWAFVLHAVGDNQTRFVIRARAHA